MARRKRRVSPARRRQKATRRTPRTKARRATKRDRTKARRAPRSPLSKKPRKQRAPKAPPKRRKQRKAEQPELEFAEQPEQGYSLCTPQGRRKFYNDVSADYDATLLKSKRARQSGLFVYMNIGLKKARGKQKVFGERRFRDLRAFKRFLLLDRHGGGSDVDWTADADENGLCRFEKTAGIAITAERDKRRVIKKTFRRYDIQKPKTRRRRR